MTSIASSRDERWLATGHADGTVQVLDISMELPEVKWKSTDYESEVSWLSCSEDNRVLISADDQQVRIRTL